MGSKTILSYEGPLSFSTIDWLLLEFKHAAQENDLSFRIYKRMISVMIEALENISKYSDQLPCDEDPTSDFCPSFYIFQNGSSLELITRNPVRKTDVKSIMEKIEHVNNRSRDELKELYRTTITNGIFTSKGGAGLGFIEMAKTSGNNLEYSFESLSPDYDLYTFRVKFNL